MTETQKKLEDYLNFAGILTCNVNPYLPCLSDIGCEWGDLTAVIDGHGLFFCKSYRKRTTYLSVPVYFLLKQCTVQKPLAGAPELLYEALKSHGPAETETLKALVHMESKTFSKAMDFLLENRYATAFRNGKPLNPTWSTFFYSTAAVWEAAVPHPLPSAEPLRELKAILTRTMTEKEFEKLIK